MFHVEHFAAFLPRNVPHGTFRAHRSAGRSCPHASPSLPAVPGGAVQDSISARGAARLFCLAYRQMKSVPGAALPPRSAPETNTLATRAKCPDHSVRRRTATRPFPRRAETKSRAPGRLLSARGKKTCTHCVRSLRTARGVSDIFHDEGKCPFRCALRAEARASPQPGGGGQRRGLSRAPDRLLSARGKKPCTHCARSLCTARDISDIFHDEEKCPFWGKRRMALPGCRARGRRTGLRLSQWWRTVSRYLPLCLRLPRAVPPACPVRPGAADGTPTSPRRAETRPSPAFVPLLIFRCPCYTVVKITA